MDATDDILKLVNLKVEFVRAQQPVRVLDGIEFSIGLREIVGILGESGCGKSVLVRTILGLIDPPGHIAGGQILFQGRDITTLDDNAWRRIRGKQIGYIPAGARGQLNPLMSVGRQISNVIHEAEPNLSKLELRARAIDGLRMLHIPDPERRVDAFPYELSGGMCQRIVIAMAIANSPKLLLADEPTSGLDVTVQRQILDLIHKTVQEVGAGVLLMTRDPGVIAHYCDRVVVLRAGRMVEESPVGQFFRQPSAPYSIQLLRKAVAARVGTTAGIVTQGSDNA
jgi:ABC-type dipeptide/oligopeptide/nickel transport system ATPase component